MACLRGIGAFVLAFLCGCGDSDATGAGAADVSSSSAASNTSTGAEMGSTSSTATASSTASSSAMSSSSSGTPSCDDDGDGFDKAGPGCCAAPDPCDCDDFNDDAFPGQVEWFSDPRPGVDPMSGLAWDYDCDGDQDKEHPHDTDGCGLLNCAAPLAFTGDNDEYFCGAPGVLVSCNGIDCMILGNIQLACN